MLWVIVKILERRIIHMQLLHPLLVYNLSLQLFPIIIIIIIIIIVSNDKLFEATHV